MSSSPSSRTSLLGLRRLNSRIESRQTPPEEAAVDRARPVTADDAIAYLLVVKGKFQHEMEKYREFLRILKDFTHQGIDRGAVVERMKELFDGDRDLIVGLNVFLPKEYQISV